MIILKGIRKTFGTRGGGSGSGSGKKSEGEGEGEGEKVAVDNLWFGLKAGDCFGFLGVNGNHGSLPLAFCLFFAFNHQQSINNQSTIIQQSFNNHSTIIQQSINNQSTINTTTTANELKMNPVKD